MPLLRPGKSLKLGWPVWLVFAPWMMGVQAAPVCSDLAYPIDAAKLALGPKHHPMGRPLPASPNFNQPDQCSGEIRFFDQNRNGIADPDEVRVFGALHQVDCGSCHGEGAESISAGSSVLSLRQDASRLCLVCHRI